MSKLFNISEASNIAVHSLALIAGSEEPMNATRIADVLQLSRNHIAKVLQVLARQGIITSRRGPKGGFNLLVDADELSLFEIYEIIDGKIEAEQCRREDGVCPFEECVFGDARQRLFEEFKSYYSGRTLGDLRLSLKS